VGRVGGEEHAGQAQLGDQSRHGRGLVGGGRHLAVGQDQRRLAGEGAEHVGGGPVVQVVEAASEGLAIEGDDRRARPQRRLVQPSGVAAEGRLEVGGIEGQEQVA
jgi:hypothetical protein